MTITLKVRDVMDKKVVSVDSSATVGEAIKKMIQNDVWSLLVEKRGLPEGVVTERDVIRRCLAKGLVPSVTTVEKIESSPLITISPEATIREAMDTMVGRKVRRLFVVEGGRIVGRVTQTELFESTFSMMESLSGLSGRL